MTARKGKRGNGRAVAQQCLMPKCRRTTTRPFGYCDHCWNKAKAAEGD